MRAGWGSEYARRIDAVPSAPAQNEPRWKRYAAEDDGTVPVFAPEITRIKHALVATEDGAFPERAIRRIEKVWQALDELVLIAESKARLLVSRVPSPTLSKEPAWLEKAFLKLSKTRKEGIDRPHRSVQESARKLVLAMLAQLPELKADISPAPGGAIEIAWQGSSLRWLVTPPRLIWPGVSVRVYVQEDPESPKLTPQTFHYAPSVLAHAERHLPRD
jgi:hypothetical protein